MIFDAFLTLLVIVMFGVEGIKALGVFAMIVLIRTCYLIMACVESVIDREDDYNVK